MATIDWGHARGARPSDRGPGNPPGGGGAAPAGAGESNTVAVADVGVDRQIPALVMKPVHSAVAADDRVIVPRQDQVIAGGGLVQVDDGRHGSTNASLQGGNI